MRIAEAAADPCLAALTFPRYGPLLAAAETGRRTAVIADDGDRPIGLALATHDEGEAVLRSVAVDRGWRRSGIATALLRRLQDELRQRGWKRLRTVYSTGTRSLTAVERLLTTCGWRPPYDRCQLFRTNRETFRPPWLARLGPPPDTAYVAWTMLSAEQRADLDRLGLAADETPFYDEDLVEPANSVALAHRGDPAGEILGWMITHRVAPHLVRYSRLWVRPEWRRTSAGPALVAEAARRHPGGPSRPYGVWNVAVDNEAMLRFARRRLVGHLVSLETSRGAVCRLDEATPS